MTNANGILSASRLSAGHFILGFVAATSLSSAAVAERDNTIPQFASAEFGWQTNVADWRDPPPGHGHGPIKPDPAHPFTSNAEAARTGTQPTKRIGNAKDPVLKPWAAALMQATAQKAAGDKHLCILGMVEFALRPVPRQAATTPGAP